jgi:glutamate-1-semialdehyde 2,1-aminomutase
MSRSLEKSNLHFQRAVKHLPLGVASNFRYWGEDRTIYVQKGRGARIWDIDGNGYIDYRLGYGWRSASTRWCRRRSWCVTPTRVRRP